MVTSYRADTTSSNLNGNSGRCCSVSQSYPGQKQKESSYVDWGPKRPFRFSHWLSHDQKASHFPVFNSSFLICTGPVFPMQPCEQRGNLLLEGRGIMHCPGHHRCDIMTSKCHVHHDVTSGFSSEETVPLQRLCTLHSFSCGGSLEGQFALPLARALRAG